MYDNFNEARAATDYLSLTQQGANLSYHIKVYFAGIAGSVPDYHNKANINKVSHTKLLVSQCL